MPQGKNDQNKNNNDPIISDGEWYALALSGAIITFVIAVLCLLWVFYGGRFEGVKDIDDIKNRIAISGMIITFCGVATTFCTVAWRGMISAQQTKISNEQLVANQKQLLLVQQNNLATILQKGAEYLEEVNNRGCASNCQ